MDQYALDPYEQQLLKVFNSHDKDNCGSLDMECLTRLCQTLQLEEQGVELVKCLVNDKHSRITFTEFKNALLALLGNMESNKNAKTDENTDDSVKTSPEREVSPKFVYGSKKYGRRSRPKNEEITAIYNEQNDPNSNKTLSTVSVQRSNSQSEVSSKKRKTNYKLKRCTSLPGHNDLLIDNTTENNTHVLLCEPELVCTEEMLREAWKKLGVGEDGYLNQNELVLVCDAIGLHKLANGVIRQLSDKLAINRNHKISFQELLAILQQDDTWFEVLNETSVIHQSPDNLFPDSRTFHFITLGPDGNGMIKTDVLIEMWENVGIHSPKELIHELGFSSRTISILELADVLEKQLKGINDVTRTEYQSPQIALLQASLSLYQSEIKTFKNILDQMRAEREKLKGDVAEANNRATLLAQEVDDNHTRMEQNTLNQVKLLEHRHTDILKEVTAQFTKDKDQLSNMNQALEDKIYNLEQEVAKLKNDLSAAQKYSLNMDKENQLLGKQITELEKDKAGLNRQIESLETDKHANKEMEREESQMVLAKLSALQLENSQLKDKNDEMVSEIESLSGQIACMRTKVSSTPTAVPNSLNQSMEENISIICEGVGLGAKRRSDYSPTKDTNLFNITDGSPRLGKIRKFHNAKRENLDIPFTSSESGFDTEVDFPDSVSCEENDNIKRLQSKIAFLEQILTQNGIPLPNCEIEKPGTNTETNAKRLSDRVRLLEMVISEIKRALTKMIEKDNFSCDDMKTITGKLDKALLSASGDEHFFEGGRVCDQSEQKSIDFSSQTDLMESFEEKVRKLEDENKELCAKCSELENCVELLRNEYEKCEDYWQSKVDDERQIFDAEQKINSDKLGELLIKMREYEEQYADQEQIDNRLPTIEETYNLEKQFTDLEQEFETYKEHSGLELTKKDEEIALLKEKLTELALRQQGSTCAHEEAEESRILNKMQTLSSYVIENTSLLSDDMLPPNAQSNISSPPPNNLEYVNQSMVWHQNPNNDPDNFVNAKSLPVDWNFTNNTKVSSNAPSSSSSSTCLDNNSTPCTPCRPKRTRKFDKNIYKKNNQEKDVKKAEMDDRPRIDDEKSFRNNYCSPGQSIFLPLRSFQNLNARRNYLEQRVRHLQVCLKQQHYCSEQTLQHYWLQFSGEKTDLHSRLKYLQDKLDQQVRISRDQLEKLERTDLLVKDLYIENAYLIASVQRLEQQCHMLAQCNSSSV